MSQIFKKQFAGSDLSIKTHYIAGQADGAVLVTYGETVVLVTIVSARSQREGLDFLPLTVDYQEMTFAAGKIPGGFFKREGRPTEKEILTARLIDRPMRPLFPKGFTQETQIVGTVLSADGANDPDVLAINGASAALIVSGAPFDSAVGAVRVAMVGDRLVRIDRDSFQIRDEIRGARRVGRRHPYADQGGVLGADVAEVAGGVGVVRRGASGTGTR